VFRQNIQKIIKNKDENKDLVEAKWRVVAENYHPYEVKQGEKEEEEERVDGALVINEEIEYDKGEEEEYGCDEEGEAGTV
jgi:hypothetical protein